MPGQNTPLLIYQPQILAVMLVFYSPIIVALLVFSMSFIFQNFKGIIYLLWVIIFSWMRSIVPMPDRDASQPSQNQPRDICNIIKYSSNSNFGNATFSAFFITFTMVYMCGPMVMNKEMNYWVLSAFLFYLFLDIGVRSYFGCVKYTYAFLDIVLGFAAGSLALTAMYSAKLYNYMFFNETSSTKDICSMPSKQTFKCAVYKNGQLVGSTNA
jgi:hypothetical protein